MTQSMTPYGEVLPPRLRSRTMENAVTLMYCGAGLSVLNILVNLAFRGGVEEQILGDARLSGGASQAFVSDILSLFVAIVVISGLFFACLWVWMAISNGNGRPWARLVATGLAAIYTLSYLSSWAVALGSTEAGGVGGDLGLITLVIGLLGQVVGWSTVYYLWHRESAPVYAVPRY